MEFEGIANARDLGGIVAGDRTVRSGLLLRSASLGKATRKDIEALEKLGVKRIVDMRTAFEAGMSPDVEVPGAEYSLVETGRYESGPFVTMGRYFSTVHPPQEAMAQFIMTDDAKELCEDFYVKMVTAEHTQKAYSQFLRILLESDGPVLWHCTQGKDRTGLGAAFILGALGADEETIIDDFSITNLNYAEDMRWMSEELLRRGAGAAEMVCVRTLVGVNVNEFRAALDRIGSEYGGMQAYLRNQLGLSDTDIEALKEKYLI